VVYDLGIRTRLRGIESKALTHTYKDHQEVEKQQHLKNKKTLRFNNVGVADLTALAAPALSYPPTT
jgi:hypothetical protein